jgi:PAS domain S-box-containing protein
MKPVSSPVPGDLSSDLKLMNEALMLGALRQHELMEAVETANERLKTEVAERLRAESIVRISETRYRRLFEESHDGVLLIDPVTRKITDANPFMSKLLGLSHDDLIGNELIEIGLLKSARTSRAMFAKLRANREVRYDELSLQSGGGSLRGVEVVANLYQENGAAVIQCTIRDITERVKIEKARRQLEILTASNLKLSEEIVRRQAVEDALTATKREQERRLEESQRHQAQLRDMSHQILRAQEEERERISRELHDVIAQTLVGINVHVAALAQVDASNTKGLRQRIARTHRLVEKSVEIVHRFACELRPAVLDDLGLIPALHSYLKAFMVETGIRSSLKCFARIEKASGGVRPPLFRVAQEALTNVARHSGATRVAVSIEDRDGVIYMKITDDGKGFEVDGAAGGKSRNRLGMLGMRERIEMLGGALHVESAPGKNTTIHVKIKSPKSSAKKQAPQRKPR